MINLPGHELASEYERLRKGSRMLVAGMIELLDTLGQIATDKAMRGEDVTEITNQLDRMKALVESLPKKENHP